MTKKYDFTAIGKKYQAIWAKTGIYAAEDFAKKPKFYALVEFPYPSGDGLHVGHVRSYTALDILARKRRMQGYNVLYPMGWDAFGLPTENYAVKTGIHPIKVTKKNTDIFRRQMKSMGFSFDWSREINTTDPEYYKWTQWIFLQLFKHGLAYKDKSTINWCPSCKIGLANEEVVAGKCERCGTPVEEREKEQWMLRITKYADKLLRGLETVDFLSRIRNSQENWIGRKEGINLWYPIEGTEDRVTVFTTRPDTNFGATFLVLAPEHPLALKITLSKYQSEVAQYIREATKKSEEDRISEGRKKTGAFTGRYAINHLTERKMPIWVSDFVLGGYGTGAVVGVPAHDIRDFEFAKQFGLEVIRVVVGKDGDRSEVTSLEQVQEEKGTMINSGFLDGMEIHAATQKIMDHMVVKGWGTRTVSYHLRDWVFSRQRYWGEPIPMVYCERCAKLADSKGPMANGGKTHKVLILHGLGGDSKENWLPWLKKELLDNGFEVIIPDLPGTNKPTLAGWLGAIKKLGLKKGDKITIVAHSLGAPAACQFILQNKLPVEKLILVAPTGTSQSEKNWQNLKQTGVKESGIKCIQEFNRVNKNLAAAKKLVGESILILSDNDPYIPSAVRMDYAALKPRVVMLKNRGHFNRASGATEFPELLLSFDFKPLTSSSGWVPVPEKFLPVKLPNLKDFKPRDDGESPLANATAWLKVKCPECGGPARRETDVMPNWAGSSWYFLRYIDPQNKKALADPKKLKYWMTASPVRNSSGEISTAKTSALRNSNGVDWYNGGMEHTTLHLLYSRFWNQFLYDIGVVPVSEPYAKRTSHGMVLGGGGIKMSKSKGNVLNPDDVVKAYGADTLRLYEMFMGPFDQAIPWDSKSIEGAFRFLNRVWTLSQTKVANSFRHSERSEESLKLARLAEKTVKKVGEDIESMSYNTAVSAMMILVNAFQEAKEIPADVWQKFLLILAPFAPHITEELYQQLRESTRIQPRKNANGSVRKDSHLRQATDGQARLDLHKFASIHSEAWPKYDPKLIQDETFTLVIQVNGKVRDNMEVPAGIGEAEAKKMALASEKVKIFLAGQEPKKVIYVPGRLVNLVL